MISLHVFVLVLYRFFFSAMVAAAVIPVHGRAPRPIPATVTRLSIIAPKTKYYDSTVKMDGIHQPKGTRRVSELLLLRVYFFFFYSALVSRWEGSYRIHSDDQCLSFFLFFSVPFTIEITRATLYGRIVETKTKKIKIIIKRKTANDNNIYVLQRRANTIADKTSPPPPPPPPIYTYVWQIMCSVPKDAPLIDPNRVYCIA